MAFVSLRPSVVDPNCQLTCHIAARLALLIYTSSLLLIIPLIPPVRRRRVNRGCPMDLLCRSIRINMPNGCHTHTHTHQIRDCNLNGSSLMSCRFGLCWGMFDEAASLRPPSIGASIRVNEKWLSFEPESRAVISPSSNTPTSSNDAKACRAMPEHEPFEECGGKKKEKK